MQTRSVWPALMTTVAVLAGCGGGDGTSSASNAAESALVGQPTDNAASETGEPLTGDLEAWCLSWTTPLMSEAFDNNDPEAARATFEAIVRADVAKGLNEAEVAPAEISGFYDVDQIAKQLEFWEEFNWDPETVPPGELEDALGPTEPQDGEITIDDVERFALKNCR